MRSSIFPLLLAVCAFLAGSVRVSAQNTARTFLTLTNLLAVDPRSYSVAGRATVIVHGRSTSDAWDPRIADYSSSWTDATNEGCIFAPDTGQGRFKFRDCDDGEVDVRHFGAVPGTTNDATPAFQAAVNSGAAVVRIPKGGFDFRSTLMVTNTVRLVGDHKDRTTIRYFGTNYAIQIGGGTNFMTRGVFLENLFVLGWADPPYDGSYAPSNALGMIHVYGAARGGLYNIRVSNAATGSGILFDRRAWQYEILEPVAFDCYAGLNFQCESPGVGDLLDTFTVINGNLSGCEIGVLAGVTNAPLSAADPRGIAVLKFINTTIESNRQVGMWLNQVETAEVSGYWEANGRGTNGTGSHVRLGSSADTNWWSVSSVSFHDNRFADTTNSVDVFSANNVKFDGNEHQGLKGPSPVAYRFSTTNHMGIHIGPNEFSRQNAAEGYAASVTWLEGDRSSVIRYGPSPVSGFYRQENASALFGDGVGGGLVTNRVHNAARFLTVNSTNGPVEISAQMIGQLPGYPGVFMSTDGTEALLGGMYNAGTMPVSLAMNGTRYLTLDNVQTVNFNRFVIGATNGYDRLTVHGNVMVGSPTNYGGFSQFEKQISIISRDQSEALGLVLYSYDGVTNRSFTIGLDPVAGVIALQPGYSTGGEMPISVRSALGNDIATFRDSGVTIRTGAGLTINGEQVTDWTGAGMSIVGGALTASVSVPDGDKGDITVSSSGTTWTVDADSVALGTDTTGDYVATVAGTANEVSVSGSGEGAAVTVSLPSTIDLGGKTSFELPNGASPTVDAFGEIAGDNDAWAASRGAVVFYDGTASTRLIGVLASDTPTAGQVPKWQTGGTITWEDDTGGSSTNAVSDGDKGDITVSSSGTAWTIDADSVALGTDTTGDYVATVAGTANEVSVSGSGEGAAVTVSLPSTIDLGGKTSFELPNGASPTVDAFGEIAGDNDAWAASRGAVVFYDGTASTRLIGVLSSDTPTAGQVPKWQTGGTITWEDDDSGAGGVSDGDKGDITVASSGSVWTIDADSVALGTDTTGNYVASVAGTANEVSVSGSGEGAAVTVSLPSTIDLGGKTSFELPNGASPTVDAFGEIAADDDAWAASRGAVVFYDGTAATRLLGVLSSDTPSNGQVPKWNTGGTITWEDDSGAGGGGDVYKGSNNVFTATNVFSKSLLLSNTVENHEIVFVGTNATSGTSKTAGHLGVWDNGDEFGALRLAAKDGHLRLQITSTNLEAHGGWNFTNSPVSAWIVKRDTTGNGESYQEGRGPSMTTASDMSEFYRLRMKAIGFHLMTGKGGIEFAPTSGLVRIQGPGTAFVAPGSGAGIEFFYDSTNTLWGSGGAGRGGISVYSRDTSTFGDLRINARQTRIQNASTDAFIVTNSLVIVTNAALRVGPTNVTDELALKAPIASPALTGNPTVPTASPGDNDTSAASTAFVTAAVAAASGGVSDGDKGDITVSSSGAVWTVDADSVALGTDTTGNYVASVAGTANEVSVSGSGEGAAVTVSLPSTIDLGGKTSFELPNGSSPTVDAFGEIAADDDAWAASRGAVVFYDGTASTRLIGVLSSDTPTAGQVPKWNTGGTITWEDAPTVTNSPVSGLWQTLGSFDFIADITGAEDGTLSFTNYSGVISGAAQIGNDGSSHRLQLQLTFSENIGTNYLVFFDFDSADDESSGFGSVAWAQTSARSGTACEVSIVDNGGTAFSQDGWKGRIRIVNPNATAGGQGGSNTNFLAGQTIATFSAPQSHAPASNPSSYGTRNAIPVLEFDASTQEQARWVISLPRGYAASTATVVLRWTTTATSGNGRWGARVWNVSGVDVDTDDFATAVEATTACSGTAGTTVTTTLSAVGLDSMVGGDNAILEVYRDTGDSADTINSNDLQLLGVEVRAE